MFVALILPILLLLSTLLGRADDVLGAVRETLSQPDRLPLIVEKRRRGIARFYRADDAGLLWYGNPRSEDLIEQMRAASSNGLRPEDYPFELLEDEARKMGPSLSAPEAAWIELLFTAHFLDFASDLRAGRVSPRVLYPDAYMPRNEIDARQALERLTASEGLDGFIEIWQPQDDTYRRLKGHLGLLLNVAAAGGFTFIEPGEDLLSGASDARVPVLRRRLHEDGLLQEASGSDVLDKRTAFAVAQAQQRYGLPVSANLTPALVRALNIPVGRRIEQVSNAMERIRWIPPEFSRLQLLVNKGENRFVFQENGRVVREGRAFANCPDRNYTTMATTIEAVTFHPTWQVPLEFLGRELLPRLQEDPELVASEGFYLRRKGADVPLSALPWNQASPRTLKRLVDEATLFLTASEQNPLGRYAYRLRQEQKLSLFDLDDVPAGETFCNPYLPKSAFGIVDGVDLLEDIIEPHVFPKAGLTERMARKDTVTFPARGGLMAVVSHESVWVQRQGTIRFGLDPYLEDARLTAALSGRPKP
jgi:murein L,D-transpeptidase YcbB/YkuD